MILDGHIHIRAGERDAEGLLQRMQAAGVDGGVLLSRVPSVFRGVDGVDPSDSTQARLDDLFCWTQASERLYPFYWIHPLDDDALEQVELAVEKGVAGFKIICGDYYPGDKRALPVYAAIAQTGRPILFHSGILWDGQPSSVYNRPAEFEPLIEIPQLRFALAHISWPWCDEAIAVYGKFLHALGARSDVTAEMFIDLTPGTPPIYRRDALTKLFTVGYDIEDNVIFGMDCSANNYNGKWAREWIERDNEIYRQLELPPETLDKIYGGNLLRFMGLSSTSVQRKTPKPGE